VNGQVIVDKSKSGMVAGGIVLALAAPAAAQTPPSQQALATMQRAITEQRYQIGVMERVLEGAVEHGITLTRDRLQAVAQMPTDTFVSDNAHARGFRLEGYGVFFDVIVPTFDTMLWSFRTLDQNDLGLNSALKALESYVNEKGDTNVQQALKRVELQVNPGVLTRPNAPANAGARNAAGSTASAPDSNAVSAVNTATATASMRAGQDPQTPASPVAIQGPTGSPGQADPNGQAPSSIPDLKAGPGSNPGAADQGQPVEPDLVLSDPSAAFRLETIQALKDAMLAHSSALGLNPGEWLTIAAKGNYDRPRLAPADSDARTVIIRLKGSDLSDFLAGRIPREEALSRIEVRVF
jgi:hypothetical protein